MAHYLGNNAKARNLSRREARKRFLIRLWHEQEGKCHWCGEQMESYEETRWNGGSPPSPKSPTRDHLDDRFSPDRGRHPYKIRSVIACWECNQKRGREAEKAQPLEVLRKKSLEGRKRKGHYNASKNGLLIQDRYREALGRGEQTEGGGSEEGTDNR